jgi:hypothetical protein
MWGGVSLVETMVIPPDKVSRTSQEASDVKRGDWNLWNLWNLMHFRAETGLCVDSEENDSEVSSEILPGLVPPVRLLEVDGVDRAGADAIKTSRTTALFLSVLDPFLASLASEASEAAALDPFLSQPL